MHLNRNYTSISKHVHSYICLCCKFVYMYINYQNINTQNVITSYVNGIK